MVVGIHFLFRQVFRLDLRVRFHAAVDPRLRMPRQDLLEIPARLTILEEHQERYAQYGDDVLQEHVHWNPENVPVDPAPENISQSRKSDYDEPVLELEVEEGHA